MTGSDDLLVAVVAIALVPLIGLRIWRGMRDGRLPLYRTRIDRAGNAARFNFLLFLHFASLLLIAAVAADLLFNLGLRDRS